MKIKSNFKNTMVPALLAGAITVGMFAVPTNSNAVNLKIDKHISWHQEKTKITFAELPDAVQKTLKGESYSGWEVTNVYQITKADTGKEYEVELKKNQETQTVLFNADGLLK